MRSQAAIPRLRMAILHSPEYDRSQLLLARAELETWLAEHGSTAQPELIAEVRRDRTDAIRRLADSDLDIARFYERVDSPKGATFHARRAFDLAREGADPVQIEEARELLQAVQTEGSNP